MSKSKSGLYIVGLAAGMSFAALGNPLFVSAKDSDSSSYDNKGDHYVRKSIIDDIHDILKDEAGKNQSGNDQNKDQTGKDKSDNKKASDSKKKVDIKYPQFKDKAVVKANGAVNIRKKGDLDGEIIGTLVQGGVCEVKQKGKEWTKISSGSCEGYVSNKYILFGDEAGKWCEKNNVSQFAQVTTDDLNVRSKKDLKSECITLVHRGEQYIASDVNGDWVELTFEDGVKGYVKSQYVKVCYDNPVAVSLAEQEAYLKALAEEEAARSAEYVAEEDTDSEENVSEEITEVADNSDVTAEEPIDESSDDDYYSEEVSYASDDDYNEETSDDTEYTEEIAEEPTEDTSDDTDYSEDEPTYDDSDEPAAEETTPDTSDDVASDVTSEETTAEEPTEDTSSADPAPAPAGADGQYLANYACQFVGNPYVWGGDDPVNGADCSGFVLALYRDLFGIQLPHDAEIQAEYGTHVNFSDLQPGDLVFYSGGGYYIGHVAIYIGNGQIVHAANPSAGIIISNYDYNDPVCATRLLGQ
ncbi:MAG: C40 family peptidase [Eubacterium sp.]|nr:C40 family peptidase [Eubacterium sp.]